MEKDLIQSLLTEVFSQLEANDSKEKKSITEGIPILAKALQHQSLTDIQAEKLTVQTADFFFQDRLTKPDKIKIEEISKEVSGLKVTAQPETKVFVREVPVRTSQVKKSVPAWAVGAKVDKTIGPITRVDGLQVFVDVYNVEKLIALRQQGSNKPLIFFKAKFTKPRVQTINSPAMEVSENYTLVAGSVWVKAKMFASNAPEDRYFGLKILAGTISLTAKPVLNGNNLLLGMNTQVSVDLKLDSPPVKGNKSLKKYGRDAAEMSLQCPEAIKFKFTGSGLGQIISAGDAQWNVYGNSNSFGFQNKAATYNTQLSRFCIPFSPDSKGKVFSPKKVQGNWAELSGEAKVKLSWWAIPAASLDINAPLEVSGIGGMVEEWESGIQFSWANVETQKIRLNESLFLVEEGRIAITSLAANGSGGAMHFDHWNDKLNPYGTSIDVAFLSKTAFLYNCLSEGTELIFSTCNTSVNVDRPKQVNGHAVAIKTKESALILAGNDASNLLLLMDDNILWDNKLPFDKVPEFKSIALALENALFTVSPVNGCMVFGKCNGEWTRILESQTYLVFGMLAYLPTLPDPYLANFGELSRSFNRKGSNLQNIKNWLVCRIIQKPIPDKDDEVLVSFHFGQAVTHPASGTSNDAQAGGLMNAVRDFESEKVVYRLSSDSNVPKSASTKAKTPDYEAEYDKQVSGFSRDFFTLLDVSSNANQVGVSLGTNVGAISQRQVTGVATHKTEAEANVVAQDGQMISVEGMQVKVPGYLARVFLLPQVAWEPVLNLTTPPNPPQPMDPPGGYNYYLNDGGPTRLINTSSLSVTLSPIPLTSFILDQYRQKKIDLLAQFTLPFGLKAVAQLTQKSPYQDLLPRLEGVNPKFPDSLQGGIQIRAIGGDAGKKPPLERDLPMFDGFTFQLNNILSAYGTYTNASTLGDSVTTIFNTEFSTQSGDPKGVPVSTIDFSGYGASMFSNWLSPSAAIASTSQARFDVMLGRTGHEVIQVKSLVYPWGIRVVRTITLFRTSSGFVYRVDSGWQPETDGKFDFGYDFVRNGNLVHHDPYEIHPGTLRGLFNIRNIEEDASIADFERKDYIKKNETYIDILGVEQTWNQNTDKELPIICRPVWFDADVELENLVQGHSKNRTPSKKILGYVQLAPTGVPLSPNRFKELLNLQGGIIGGDINCIMDVNKSGQQMRISRFDFSHATSQSSSDPIFVASSRGSLILPKTGSWTVVQHNVSSGDVTPLPPHIPVPLIRVGKWVKDIVVKQADVNTKLLRLASPSELLRNPDSSTVNFGILQTTASQKALVLTPSFENGTKKLLSKTPMLYADAYRLMAGSGIFPNAGNGIDEFGKAAVLFSGALAGVGAAASVFKENGLEDGGVKVLEMLKIELQKEGESIIDQGFELLSTGANDVLKKAVAFDLPPIQVYLVDMEALKIYIDYQTGKKEENPNTYVDSKLNFDIDSFANDTAKSWKSRLNNLAMVVDLGSFKRLMTIKGNFDAKKGKESGYEGFKDDDFPALGLPTPEIEFSDELQPVIDILQLLASLSTGDYGAVMQKGLKIAMSNAGEIWEYKFEASKEIPLVRFPPEENAYNSPQTPLKLEAGLSLGVYFNAALKVTTDPKQLLPTAGAFIEFRGGLEVMCVTVGGATIFAIGEVQLKVACDTKIGPSLTMKLGFGATIAVGLPVVGNVSVTYMVGCEMYASADLISVTAFMLFRGKASLVGGLVAVTIYIEASGTVTRLIPEKRTECTASVTFGLEISICFIINIDFEETWQESRQIA
ncbi:hypothetical protein [Algoriphagus winogradskyi]|uniref:LysM domain-containing protein n=1 Tax=Algoriphagus winogradskyi TaxID=237017 RepID=A0ABY1PIC8_9BACT|nr:hypothetical protein [Algoriphagus winogradskyi]SMP32638.1 hypothetical protein SAMN06265367_10855 [Algoriphagus winogradskyi]